MKYFIIQEFVDKATYQNLGPKGSLWMMNPTVLSAMDKLREAINSPIIINNWNWGGLLQYRGFRPSYCTTGSPYSQHKLGNAVDFHCKHLPIASLHKWINEQHPFLYEIGFRAVEDFTHTPSWVHLDCRPFTELKGSLLMINP